MRRGLVRFLVGLCVLLLAGAERGHAHVGSPDIYVKATAGPYQLLVSVHPPAALPGAAGVDVRTDDPDVRVVSVSLPGGSPETLQRFTTEQIFTGSVWVASGGSWRVVIHVKGEKGDAETTVPVPVLSDTTKGLARFNRPQWWGLGLVLVVCAALILVRRSRITSLVGSGLIAVIFVVAVVVALRRPSATPQMQVSMIGDGRLRLTLPGKMDDLMDDHNHRMHLFAVREPEMDVLIHLHPQETGPGQFEVTLPSMAPGAFRIFADVVHQDGSLQTFTADLGLPVEAGRILGGDDSVGVVPGLSRAEVVAGPGTTSIRLMDGYSMTLDLSQELRQRSGQLLRFELTDPAGDPPTDMQMYMGMQAHAEIIKTDGTVFAHIHPAGTIPMAAYGAGPGGMSGMAMDGEPSNEVSMPFGFPSAGRYRVFLQMKHGGIIETGAFDLTVR